MTTVKLDGNIDDTARSLAALAFRGGGSWSEPVELCLDLTDCNYLGPMGVANLSALLVDRAKKGWTTTVKPPANAKLLGYCRFSGFAALAWSGPEPDSHSENETMPLSVFVRRDNDGARQVCDLVRRHMQMGAHLENVLKTSIGELTQNVEDHSNATGVLSARYFKTLKRLRVCVADAGVGLRSVLTESPSTHNDVLAVKLALERGRSRRSQSHNAGQGLDLLDTLVKYNSGRLLLASGKAYYQRDSASKSDVRVFERAVSVPGTVCLVEFIVDNELYPDQESNDDIWDS